MTIAAQNMQGRKSGSNPFMSKMLKSSSVYRLTQKDSRLQTIQIIQVSPICFMRIFIKYYEGQGGATPQGHSHKLREVGRTLRIYVPYYVLTVYFLFQTILLLIIII